MYRLDNASIRRAYSGWAPIYDYSFGLVSAPGRRLAVRRLAHHRGRILEIGVGTGLSLPRYGADVHITGIDLSTSMLEIAHERVRHQTLRASLCVMDAGHLGFANESFDAIAAIYVMTVVPDPALVMGEIVRTLKPGGEVVIVNHFSQDHGLRGAVERGMAQFARRLGWHPVFPVERVMTVELTLVERVDLAPLGLFSMLRFVKT